MIGDVVLVHGVRGDLLLKSTFPSVHPTWILDSLLTIPVNAILLFIKHSSRKLSPHLRMRSIFAVSAHSPT